MIPSLSKGDTTGGSFYETHSDAFLEQADGTAERGIRDAQKFGTPTKAERRGNSGESPKLTEITAR